MKYIYLAPLYAKATEALRHSTQLSSTRNRIQAYRTQVRLGSPRPIAHCTSQYSLLCTADRTMFAELCSTYTLWFCNHLSYQRNSFTFLTWLWNIKTKARPSKVKAKARPAKATTLKAKPRPSKLKPRFIKAKATMSQSQSQHFSFKAKAFPAL